MPVTGPAAPGGRRSLRCGRLATLGRVTGFVDVRRPPDLVRVFGADGELPVHATPDGLWAGHGVVVGTVAEPDHLAVRLTASVGVCRIQLRWHGDPGTDVRYLGDHWERGYGDLEWRGEVAERVLPWYLLTHRTEPGVEDAGGAGGRTHGYGVRVGAGALCFWTADRSGLSLWADVRSGGRPVQLRGRPLAVADVVGRPGVAGESAFQAQQALCRALCPRPLLPDHPVYGTNDWYAHYGRNSLEKIARASDRISRLSPDHANRPYSVIDDGWSQGGLGLGPWFGNEHFGDMAEVADRLRDLGVRPGLWYRPLTCMPGVPAGLRMAHNGCLDPSLPEVLDLVAGHVRRMAGWGYQLIKHDYTTWDVLGRWGFAMGATVTDDGWGFATADRTTAEVLLGLYRALREAAGPVLLIGCNTVGHLAAGLVELQRIGDDVSGVSWHRTRRMGVNTLAFRAAQHGTFFAADADIAPVTPGLPWPLARQWLDLLAASGTPLFVSVPADLDDPAVLDVVGAALARAARPAPLAEPLDWLHTRSPARWRLAGGERSFDWNAAEGGWPFGD
jgi:alpha-galactosidase